MLCIASCVLVSFASNWSNLFPLLQTHPTCSACSNSSNLAETCLTLLEAQTCNQSLEQLCASRLLMLGRVSIHFRPSSIESQTLLQSRHPPLSLLLVFSTISTIPAVSPSGSVACQPRPRVELPVVCLSALSSHSSPVISLVRPVVSLASPVVSLASPALSSCCSSSYPTLYPDLTHPPT